MKPATIILIVAGALLLVGGTWVSLVVPLRTEVMETRGPGGGELIGTKRRNLWGKDLHYTSHVTYASEDQKPHGEGVGPIADEYIVTGALDWSGKRHGPWTTRERNGTTWTETAKWYLHGKKVIREEWERR